MNELLSIVDNQYNGRRINEYLKNPMRLTSTLIKKVKYGGVFINGQNVHMRATVATGDRVCVRIINQAESDIVPIPMKLDVIYEDDYFIAVNKPKGMPTHPSRGNHLPTLAQGVIALFSPKKFTFRAINRLDRDTSGIVIIAKDQYSCAALSSTMKEGGFKKVYEAYVNGIPQIREGIIDAPIARECEGNIKRVVRQDGKKAISEYKVIHTLDNGNCICEIVLHTGRTHQIRVHMAHIGHPLVNDFLYGVQNGNESYKLHAKRIEFVHPITKEYVILESSPDFGI